jgi:pimeloyl-ACP methyl ester carboxylesterase
MKMILRIVLFSLVLVSCVSNNNLYESIEKNKEFREEVLKYSNGKYASLTNGNTYYEEANPNSDKGTVVLVHGFSVPSYIWKVTFNTLKDKEYHVVMMDLFGRGNSDNPDLPQTDQLRALQVLELINELKIDKAVLVGLSNGGRIISKMAALNSEKIQALFYVSASSFMDYKKPTSIEVSSKEIEDFIATYPTRSEGQLADFYDQNQFPDWPNKYEKLLYHKGFAKALISTQKNLTTMDDIHVKIDSLGLPVYVFWGIHDEVVSYAAFKEKLKMLLPNRKEFFIEKAAHLPHMENQEVFENLFLTSLTEINN